MIKQHAAKGCEATITTEEHAATSPDFLERWSENKWVACLCGTVVIVVSLYLIWVMGQVLGAGADHWRKEVSSIALSICVLAVVVATFLRGFRGGVVALCLVLASLSTYQIF